MHGLAVGQVLHLWCAACTTPKWKYHVLSLIEPRPRFMLINSQPAAFQQQNPVLMAHQVTLDVAGHAFLQRDSVLDCSTLMGGPPAGELEDLVSQDPRVLMGSISHGARRNVRRVISGSPLLTQLEIDALLTVW